VICEKEFGKKPPPTTVSIYRRNLQQRAYIERMEYLMKEEIKPSRSDYYNVSQSDVRALVRGELVTLKSALGNSKE
jgi:hypothetical protein